MHLELDPAQKKKIFLGLLGGLAAVILIIVGVVIALESGVETGPTYSGLPVPDNELLVSDIYEGDTLIPKLDLPRNKYDPKKFKEVGGFLRYEDSKAALGVDVSEYQGNIDWKAVKDAGIDFAIIRLGWRGMTQGLLNVDETFEQNFAGATEAGLPVGVYFFSQAITEAEAKAEADFVVKTLNGRELTYPVVFDWEPPEPTEELPAGKLRAYDVPGKKASEIGVAFCERIRENGYRPCVYTNKYWSYEFFDLNLWADYDIWYAEYRKTPSFYYDFRMWQYTAEGHVPGIESGVDLNICFKKY